MEQDNFKKEYKAKVINKTMLNSDTCLLTLSCSEIARVSKPGQFVNISCSYFLKRPFGIASADSKAGTIKIGVKIVGKGTNEIVAFEEGKEIDILGPLGNGFDLASIKKENKKVILVAGGTGVFPINFTHEYCEENGIENIVVQGFRNKEQLVLSSDEYIVCTDNGEVGIHGNCCNGLDSINEEFLKDAVLMCVGPLPMMNACGKWATEHGLKCFVSMEQRMACGIGICLVCVCKLKSEANGEEFKHVRCCKDGPVFPYEEVIFND